MTTEHQSLRTSDIDFVLHPYTNAIKHREIGPIIIERGEGIYVYDDSGNQFIEGMAGLWSVAVGFNEQRLVDAATQQLKKLPFYHSFTHKTHTPSIKLAEQLVKSTNHTMSRAFFTNSGSEANDTVIKILWYYNNALNRPKKKKIISRQRAYHGVTVATASLTGLAPNHTDFDLPIPQVLHTRCPDFYREGQPGETEEQFAQRLADELEELILSEGADTIAGFIGEPVMGAGGVVVPPKTYWQRIQEVCRKYDVLIIADEVITGFGRLGKMYGSEVFDIEPDMMVLSKQLTSSYLPFAALLINEKIDDVISTHSGKLGVFGHGYTASGHPVAAALASENIRIIEEDGLVENAAKVGKVLQAKLREFQDHPLVGEVRGLGLIAAVELVADKTTRAKFDPAGSVGTKMAQRCHEKGLIVRNIQDTIAFCPPLIITEEQVNDMVARFGKSLEEVTATL